MCYLDTYYMRIFGSICDVFFFPFISSFHFVCQKRLIFYVYYQLIVRRHYLSIANTTVFFFFSGKHQASREKGNKNPFVCWFDVGLSKRFKKKLTGSVFISYLNTYCHAYFREKRMKTNILKRSLCVDGTKCSGKQINIH